MTQALLPYHEFNRMTQTRLHFKPGDKELAYITMGGQPIPRVGEEIRHGGIAYMVIQVVHNWDKGEVEIFLTKLPTE